MMKIPSRGQSGKTSRKIRIVNPSIRTFEDEQLWRDVHKYAQLIASEPEPNMGRVREIKDELKAGHPYVTPEVIEETAARLAIRFMHKE